MCLCACVCGVGYGLEGCTQAQSSPVRPPCERFPQILSTALQAFTRQLHRFAMELDEPIDYSTAAYRLAKSVNDYFAGWEPSPEYLSAAEFEEFRQKELGTCDAVTQTPPEWLSSEPAQRPTEAAPGRAPPTERTLSIGTNRPQAPASPDFPSWP